MQEKEVTINDATLVWWFIFWRTFVVMFLLEIVGRFIGMMAGGSTLIESLVGWGVLILGIFFTVLFTRQAINRNYKSKAGSFRLTAQLLDEKVVADSSVQTAARAEETAQTAASADGYMNK